MNNLGEQGFCSKCGDAYLSDKSHSINCLSSQSPDSRAEKIRNSFERFNGKQISDIIEMSFNEGFNAALEQAAEIADKEEELEGPIPPGGLEKILQNPEIALRATVRVIKRNIANGIRVLKKQANERKEIA